MENQWDGYGTLNLRHSQQIQTQEEQGNCRDKVTRMMRGEAPRQFLPNVRSSGLAFRLALAKG